MPFSETSGQEHRDISARSGESESSTSREREKTEERKQEALRYLVDTGRVTTPEEAEQYLESLHRLKERVITILCETTPLGRTLDQDLSLFAIESEESRPFREPADAVLRPAELDSLDPRIWIAKSTVAPAVMGSAISYENALLLPMSGNRKIGIRTGGWGKRVAERLYENLSPEERKLLTTEYILTRRELVEQLRRAAEDWEERNIGLEWEPLFGIPPQEDEDEGVAE